MYVKFAPTIPSSFSVAAPTICLEANLLPALARTSHAIFRPSNKVELCAHVSARAILFCYVLSTPVLLAARSFEFACHARTLTTAHFFTFSSKQSRDCLESVPNLDDLAA